MAHGKKVVVGMSGGVDSAAAALLLLEQGLSPIGVTLRLWGEETAAEQAAALCRRLGIPHHTLDLRERFWAQVITPFADAYTAGQTPNPCVLCNRRVKFAALAEAAQAQGADFFATGHYARAQGGLLYKGTHAAKEQSYVLWALPREWVGRLLLPLGERTKGEIRALTEAAGLEVAHKPDSQDICFVPNGDYAAFLEEIRPGQNPPGLFVDGAGASLGAHRGLWRYTVGQRKGLGISFGRPMYVTELAAGNVVLGDNDSLYRKSLTAWGVNWQDREALARPEPFEVKLRYAAPARPATVTPQAGDRVAVEFLEPQRAITPGQSAVFYKGDLLCGGGIIE